MSILRCPVFFPHFLSRLRSLLLVLEQKSVPGDSPLAFLFVAFVAAFGKFSLILRGSQIDALFSLVEVFLCNRLSDARAPFTFLPGT